MSRSPEQRFGRLLALVACGVLAMGSQWYPQRPWTVDDLVLHEGGVLALSHDHELYWWDMAGDGSLRRLTSAGVKAFFIAERQGVAVATVHLGAVVSHEGFDSTWIGPPDKQAEGWWVEGSQVQWLPPVISADGTHTLVARPVGLFLVDLATREETEVLATDQLARRRPDIGLAVSPGGEAVAVSTDEGVRVVSWPGGGREVEEVVALTARWVEFSGDGRWLAVLTAGGLDVVELPNGAPQRIAKPRDVEGFQFWRPGEIAVFEASSFTVWELAPGEGARQRETVKEERIKCLFEAGVGRAVGLTGRFSRVEGKPVVWETGGDEWKREGEYLPGYGVPKRWVPSNTCAHSHGFDVDASSGRIAMAGRPAKVVDLNTGTEISLEEANGRTGIRLLPGKNQVVTAGLDGVLTLYSLAGPTPTVLRQVQLPTGADRAWLGAATALAVMLLAFWGGFRPATGKLSGREEVARGLLWALVAALAGGSTLLLWTTIPMRSPGYHANIVVWAIAVIGIGYLGWRLRRALVGALAHSLVAGVLAGAVIGYDFALAGYQAIHPPPPGSGHNPYLVGGAFVFVTLVLGGLRGTWMLARGIPSVGLTGLVRALAWVAGLWLVGGALLIPLMGPFVMVNWTWVVFWPAAAIVALRWRNRLVGQARAQ